MSSHLPRYPAVTTTTGLVLLVLLVAILVGLLVFIIVRLQRRARHLMERTAADLRQSQEALRASESRLRRLVDANIIGIIITDFHGKIIEANDAFLDTVGYSREEVTVGKMNWNYLTPPEYHHLDEQALAEMKRTGKHAPFEKEYVRKDGTRVPVLVGTAYLGGPDELGLGFMVDITERKRAEEALHQAERRAVTEYERLLERISSLAQALGAARDLATIFDALRDFAVASVPCAGITISLYDSQRNVRKAAYAWVEGEELDVSKLPEMPVGDGPNSSAIRTGEIIITNDNLDAVQGHPAAAAAGPNRGVLPQSSLIAPMAVMRRMIGTIEVQSYDRGAYDYEHVSAMRMAANLSAIAIENVRLFERERGARSGAEESNRLKDEFLATLSHELRTPMTAILGWTHLLRSGRLDSEATARALDIIERNAKSQTQLIDELLDVSRVITGKLRIDVRSVDLASVIEAAIDTARLAIEAKGIQMEPTIFPEVGPVPGDPDRLQQVVWNLLSNAVKFTPEGGRIQVRLERNASHALITVTDTGQGIAPEFLPHVFDRFRQADSTSTREHGGLGLGLAIVRHLVELHGGAVYAESRGEGLGATFAVQLPLVSAHMQTAVPKRLPPAAKEKEPTNGNYKLDGLCVLVVDDEDDTRALLIAVLEQYGCAVVAVPSAAAALDALERVRPDVMVSDIGMPHQDGYQLIRKMRAMKANSGGETPAVALTAYARDEDREQALSAGYQVHLTKPVEPARLVEVVANLAARHGDNGRGGNVKGQLQKGLPEGP